MTPSEAMKIVENPDDYSAEKVRQAKKFMQAYSEKTRGDKSTGDSEGIAVIITAPTPKPKRKPKPKSKKAQMMRGGMANGKVHMYSAGGSVKDLNPGLRALQKERPDVVAKILKNK